MLEKYDDILRIKDLCDILHIGRNTAYKLIKEKKIPSKSVGGKYLIPKAALIKFLSVS